MLHKFIFPTFVCNDRPFCQGHSRISTHLLCMCHSNSFNIFISTLPCLIFDKLKIKMNINILFFLLSIIYSLVYRFLLMTCYIILALDKMFLKDWSKSGMSRENYQPFTTRASIKKIMSSGFRSCHDSQWEIR